MEAIKKGIILSTLLLFSLLSFSQEIDSQNSVVNFKISNIGFNKVKGTFTGMKGEINFSPSDYSNASFNVCVDAASIDSGNKKRDEHLRNADFFNVAKFPSICFVSKSIEKTEKGYTVFGELSLHGITKNVGIPFTYMNSKLEGTLTINRFDYAVGEGTGSFMVGNEVELTIICKLREL